MVTALWIVFGLLCAAWMGSFFEIQALRKLAPSVERFTLPVRRIRFTLPEPGSEWPLWKGGALLVRREGERLLVATSVPRSAWWPLVGVFSHEEGKGIFTLRAPLAGALLIDLSAVFLLLFGFWAWRALGAEGLLAALVLVGAWVSVPYSGIGGNLDRLMGILAWVRGLQPPPQDAEEGEVRSPGLSGLLLWGWMPVTLEVFLLLLRWIGEWDGNRAPSPGG